jgi:hypothetical protein
MGKLQWCCVALALTASVAAIVWGVWPEKRPVYSRANDLFRAQADRRLDFPVDDLAIDAAANRDYFLDQALGHATRSALVPLWRDKNGNQFAVTLLDGASGEGAIWKISPDARVRNVYDFEKTNARWEAGRDSPASVQFASILDALMTPAPGRRGDELRLVATPSQ